MRYFFSLTLILGFMLLTFSCKETKSDKSAPIDVNKMSNILLDMQLAEIYSHGLSNDSIEVMRNSRNYDSMTVFYKSILSKYQISYDQFQVAFDWYNQSLTQMDTLYKLLKIKLDSLTNANNNFVLPPSDSISVVKDTLANP